ncbi:bifunctional (p)ppGpp synthetase/guanosine-3',5'-bis(diphosphate) 3'-pyrophosphohydrolase [Acetobacteraceae bacterium]|nr:bifunctional (p)ppGpp synthetase/guanosine-3',5'-bis(diphosphate) 3'-pyrophosphohydrolase [Acetobacteraceae bacterium]
MNLPSLLAKKIEATVEEAWKEDLESNLLSYLPLEEVLKVKKALLFAATSHGDQSRDSGELYITHPISVAHSLVAWKMDSSVVIAAFLHDVPEDTGVSLDEISELFGEEVAFLVDGVTKLKKMELHPVGHKQAQNFRKLVLAMAKDVRVLLIKLADRLHNVGTLRHIRSEEKRRRIAVETLLIYVPLAERLGMYEVKNRLERQAFSMSEPKADIAIREHLNHLRTDGGEGIDSIILALKENCQKHGYLSVEIFGREKTPYSIWRKMNAGQLKVTQLSDVLAFRIIVEDVASCYAVLGILHHAYRAVNGKFKDYISTPKANGYQSIHTVLNLQNKSHRIEIQIRTKVMHEQAEHGISAHWIYKEGSTLSAKNGLKWLKNLSYVAEHSIDTRTFEIDSRLELYEDEVFCFTPKGDIICLPAGATPIDFAYAVHTEIGDRCVGSRANGKWVRLSDTLENGDEIEIMTALGAMPQRNWAEKIVSGKARTRVRQAIQKLDMALHQKKGQRYLAQIFNEAGVAGDEKILATVLEKFSCSTMSVLYQKVGLNIVSAEVVLRTIYPRISSGDVELARERSSSVDENSSLIQEWEDIYANGGIHLALASCCAPLPGDAVSAVLDASNICIVHRSECHNLAEKGAESFPVMWNLAKQDRYPHLLNAHLFLVIDPRLEATAGIVPLAEEHESILERMNVVMRQDRFAEIQMDLKVPSWRHLEELLEVMQKRSGFFHAARAIFSPKEGVMT